eukprot:TRINITY_DN29671_c0_g1_i2.p1 TRINITY_DN29671_c0_g1~~TRINITY_DN29671_c0_g1_i2.p1  ORF type:complete len:432 (-),score=89.33 TRINITY_DN29671_c0_g1_i2:98-1348(-)
MARSFGGSRGWRLRAWAESSRPPAAQAPVAGVPVPRGRSPPVAANPADFELWSFNLRTEFKDQDDGPNGWRYRRFAAADLVRKRRPALVCVQEATPAMLDFLVSDLGASNYGWLGTSRSLRKGDEMAGFLFDKRCVDVVLHQTLWLAPDGVPRGEPGWDAMYPRTVEAGVFRLLAAECEGEEEEASSGRRELGLIRVLNTHLDHVGEEARRQSAELIARTVAMGAVEFPQCVHVVAGDFNNVKAFNPVYDTLTRPEIGLSDVVVHCAAGDVSDRRMVPFTLHKFRGLAFGTEQSRGDGTVSLDVPGLAAADDAAAADWDARPDARHIDWIFFRNGSDMQLEPVDFEVMTDRAAGADGPYLSDHFPLRVQFRLLRSGAAGAEVWHESQLGGASSSDGPIASSASPGTTSTSAARSRL